MKRKKKPRRRLRPAGSPSSNAPQKRRLPAPKMASKRWPKSPPSLTFYPQDTPPHTAQIVELIEHVAGVSQLNPFVILTDWIGMMEASLQMWTENMKMMVTTGHFAEDPPQIKEIYAKARTRYTRASEKQPAVYRLMQETFPATFALLLESTAPGLQAYGQQVELNPDIIGQVFVACLRPGPQWLQFFPAWSQALAVAKEAIPDGNELVYTALVEAAVQADVDGHPIDLEPGVNFAEWFEVVQPYVEPVIIGPNLIDSPTMLLALAAQFSDWVVQSNLVRFCWHGRFAEPLLEKMASFNAMAYGLNGYFLQHRAMLGDILAHQQQQDEQPQPAPASPAQIYQQTIPLEPVPRRESPTPPPSFTDLFRH